MERRKLQMKLKYYLRGLGIGIIITTAIMSFTRQPEKLTDTQIKARARELGMVEKSVLADFKQEEEWTFEKNAGEGQILQKEDEKKENEIEDATDENYTDEVGFETEENDKGTINESSSSAEGIDEVVESYIVISIDGGNGSEIVCRKLFEAGLVDSEVEYNQFLVKKGYDKKLRPGNHEIPVGATDEEMAKILCGMN